MSARPRYNFTRACAFAGADNRQATNWFQHGGLDIGEVTGPRTRLFDREEILHLGVFARLVRLTTPARAKPWAAEGVAQFVKMGTVEVEPQTYLCDWPLDAVMYVVSIRPEADSVSVYANREEGEMFIRRAALSAHIFVPIGEIARGVYEHVSAIPYEQLDSKGGLEDEAEPAD